MTGSMTKKLFLDTNIVIDLIDEARALHVNAKETIFKIIEEDYEVYVSEDMISTVYYVLKGNSKVLYFFKNILKEWNVVSFGNDVINEAIDFCLANGSDLEDTMQCLCAKKIGSRLFLTNNRRFVDCGVELVTYEQFLQK